MTMLMKLQDLVDSFDGELLDLPHELLTSDDQHNASMHTCRAGKQILRMPAKVPGFLIVRCHG